MLDQEQENLVANSRGKTTGKESNKLREKSDDSQKFWRDLRGIV